LNSIRPDIIHIFLITSGIWMSFPSWISKVGIKIYAVRSSSNRNKWWVDLINRLFIVPFIDYITFVSEESKSSFLSKYNYPLKKTFVIRNGINIRKYKSFRPIYFTKDLIISCVGRLAEVKGMDLVLRAFQGVLQRRISAKLWLIGDGPKRKYLLNLSEKLGLNQHVEFLGEKSNIPFFLKQTDIYISGSRWEGIPNALLEAMAAGLPIVATKVGGVPEILDENTAIMVPPEDSEALLKGILKLVGNPSLAGELGKNARRRVSSNYSMEKMIFEYTQLYQKLINSNEQ
jgi:glycosyltransferase involved in cell wall biosynthesis